MSTNNDTHHSEYLVKVRAIIPGFFSSRSIEEAEVVQADSADEAVRLCKQRIQRGLAQHDLDPEDDRFSIAVVDVRRI